MRSFKKLGAIAMTVMLVLALCSCSAAGAGAPIDTSQNGRKLADANGEEQTVTTQTEQTAAYLFVHFVGRESSADDEQIYFSVSQNGTDWETLNYGKPVLKSTVGERGVRDPHIIRSPEGDKFYLIATDLSIYNINGNWGASQTDGSKSIVIWESDDLLQWSEPRLREIARQNAGCTWAPESIYDEERGAYMVFWASKTGEDWTHRIYRSYTTDFDTFTPPEVYMESDVSLIDTTFLKEGDTYYRFTKNEAATYVYMEKSKSLNGDFEAVSTFTVNGDSGTSLTGYEGPTVYKLNGQDKWCMLLDNYGTGAGYKPFVTDDIATGRFASGTAFNFGGTTFRHGTVMPITQAEYDALKAAYDKPLDPPPAPVFSMEFPSRGVTPEQGAATASSSLLTYDTGVKGGEDKAAKFSSGALGKAYITLTADKDGNNPLAGRSEYTVSFAVKPTADGAAWWFYAAPDETAPVYQKEKYIGVRTQNGKVYCERYDNDGGRSEALEGACAKNAWQHITIVLHADKTQLFVNGTLVSTVASSVDSAAMLGATPVIQLGKANWGGGEYADGCIDSVRIHDRVLTETEVVSNYKDAMGKA